MLTGSSMVLIKGSYRFVNKVCVGLIQGTEYLQQSFFKGFHIGTGPWNLNGVLLSIVVQLHETAGESD